MKRYAGYVSLSVVAGCLAAFLLFVGPASANPGASGGSVSSGSGHAVNGSTASGCGVATDGSTASGDCGPAAPAARPAVAQSGASLALTGSDSLGLVRAAFVLTFLGSAVMLLTVRRQHSPA